MEVSRLDVESELQLPAYTTATATPEPSHNCHLHHSSQQCWILNPLSKATDRICILMETTSGSQPTEPQWELQSQDLNASGLAPEATFLMLHYVCLFPGANTTQARSHKAVMGQVTLRDTGKTWDNHGLCLLFTGDTNELIIRNLNPHFYCLPNSPAAIIYKVSSPLMLP